MPRLIIYATNVHQGGGKFLLKSMLNILAENKQVFFCIDERMDVPENISLVQIRKTKGNLLSRLTCEWWLKKNIAKGDVVLCFGNLPPLFRSSGFVVVFLQNRFLVDNFSLKNFSLSTKLRIIAERFWFAKKTSNVDEFIVQTESMRRLMLKFVKNNVHVMPFMDYKIGHDSSKNNTTSSLCDFLYIASGEPHKNHTVLVEAWCKLAKEGFFPTLNLTLNEEVYSELCSWIAQMVTTHNLKIMNLGMVSHENIHKIYKRTKAIIYPSKLESFGLPLLEANLEGLPILASELDFVRDVIKPAQTFDPNSAISIARAVKRHLNIPDELVTITNSHVFIESVLRMSRNE